MVNEIEITREIDKWGFGPWAGKRNRRWREVLDLGKITDLTCQV
jgi:hypothetical protein